MKNSVTDSITELERFREIGSETNPQELFWKGKFGDEYTGRNRVRWLERVPFWHDIITKTSANSAFEVGCNAGWNLLALRTIKPGMVVRGLDINDGALTQAEACGLVVYRGSILERSNDDLLFDLVFTAGVLIHLPRSALESTMGAITRLSRRYVLAVEYAAEHEEEVVYRGHHERLWKRPYGLMYENMGLSLVSHGMLGKEDGFDNCHWWLMEKK